MNSNLVMILLFITLWAAFFVSGCTTNYGVRHTIEDYDIIRFEYTTIGAEAEVSKDIGGKVCPRVSAFIGGEHDIAGDPYKIVSAGVNCSLGWW